MNDVDVRISLPYEFDLNKPGFFYFWKDRDFPKFIWVEVDEKYFAPYDPYEDGL